MVPAAAAAAAVGAAAASPTERQQPAEARAVRAAAPAAQPAVRLAATGSTVTAQMSCGAAHLLGWQQHRWHQPCAGCRAHAAGAAAVAVALQLRQRAAPPALPFAAVAQCSELTLAGVGLASTAASHPPEGRNKNLRAAAASLGTWEHALRAALVHKKWAGACRQGLRALASELGQPTALQLVWRRLRVGGWARGRERGTGSEPWRSATRSAGGI